MLAVAPSVNVSDSQTFNRGDDVILNCSAGGGPQLLYQWQLNGENLTGEVNSTLALPNINASHGGMYTCVVSNVAGSDSDSVIVSIAPYFTVLPQDTNGTNGGEVTLICEAEAFPELQYRWRRLDGMIRSDINVTSSILRFDPVQFGDEGMYVCEVTSDNLNITSDDVTITSKLNVLFVCFSS